MELPENKSNQDPSLLTSIRDTYTLSSTPEDTEIDKVVVSNFLRILAEVAVNIASRRSGNDKSTE